MVSSRLIAFAFVGAAGLAVYLACLTTLFELRHFSFTAAQIVASFAAITVNFLVNNLITYRDRRLRGLGLAAGLAAFWLACSFGVLANVSCARSLLQLHTPWYVAGVAGLAVSSAWNSAVNGILTRKRVLSFKRASSVSTEFQPADLSQTTTGRLETLPDESGEKIVA